MNTVHRRLAIALIAFIATLFALATGTVAGIPEARAASGVHVTVGGLLYGPYETIVYRIIQERNLFQQAGKELGIDIDPEFKNFPTGAPIVQGMTGGTVDLGSMGFTPLINLLATGKKVVPLSAASGKFRFMIVVRKDSPIRNLEDLRGKRVAVVVGTDLEGFLNNVARYYYGAKSAKELFTLVNVQTPTQAAQLPTGADAGVTVSSAYLTAHRKLGTEALMNGYGQTESYYRGPAGTGTGHMLKGSEKSPFAPEAFMAHRSLWVMSETMLKQQPKVAEAWMIAEQRAMEIVNKMSPKEAGSYLSSVLELTPDEQASVVNDELIRARGFVWLTRGEALIAYLQAQDKAKNGAIKQAFTWNQIKDVFTEAAPQAEAAFKATGATTTKQTFEDSAADLRGAPVWAAQQWKPPVEQ